MTCLRPLLVILSLCLALIAPAQASGLLGMGSDTCRHAAVDATRATAPGHFAHDALIAPPCHIVCAIVEALAIIGPDADAAIPVGLEHRLVLSQQLAGIERPPKTPAFHA